MLEKRIEILIVVMFEIVFGSTMWVSLLRGSSTGSYDVGVIYFGAVLFIYVIYYLMKQAWSRTRGISYLSLNLLSP